MTADAPVPPPAPSIVPPYVLARIASTPETGWRRAAVAARATLRTRPAHLPAPPSPAHVRGRGTVTAEREISDAQHREVLPGVVVRREGDPPTDDLVVGDAYDGLGATSTFFRNAFGRSGIDADGGELRATVHYGRAYDNAFWNGERMVFGDGDGEVFRGFAGSLTVVAHELAHGVTENEGGLRYQGQSGALNESLSDVFGALTEQYTLAQTVDRATWLIGAEIFTDQVQGRALRSLAQPGTAYDDDVLGRDPQPGHLRDYVVTSDDNGGVHINSGIPNKAFHLAAASLGGYAWERAGRIWYDTLVSRVLPHTCDFVTFARATTATAAAVYGEASEELDAVREAWIDAGVEDDRTG
ncbi:M4 family metallopeptidase [Microbacterium sp. SSW1-59]|uniref:M4 family metallopeptidase n=1 Tax=Microbacterium xanthum TaxID=3079794 RepID=UPI002AD29B9B|nr:M4 family metallopeptidase [Microbacterium sp. SSW1-59]MDZ8201650.1 M4 family metallopeptidase [Microbacterium sp. SSW1-59]